MNLDQEVNQEWLGLLVDQGSQVCLEKLEDKVRQDPWECQDQKVLMVLEDLQEIEGPLVHRECQEWRE